MKRLIVPIVLLFAACGKEKVSLQSFREIQMPISSDLSAVWFTDTLHGAISAGVAWESGHLLSTTDGGEHWTIDTSLNRKMEHVTFSPDGQGYACGQDKLFFRPAQGTHWQLLREDFQWLRCAHFPAANYGAVVGGEGFHDGQLRVFGPQAFWLQDTLHDFLGELDAVWYVDQSTIMAVGAGWVVRSEDGGQSWERLHITGDIFTSVHFPDSQHGFICGNSGQILKSSDGGKNWETLRKGGITGKRNKGFRAIWFSSAEKGWLVGDDGIFWTSDNGGKSWKQVAAAPKNADYTDVFVLAGKGWATARGGRFFVFEY